MQNILTNHFSWPLYGPITRIASCSYINPTELNFRFNPEKGSLSPKTLGHFFIFSVRCYTQKTVQGIRTHRRENAHMKLFSPTNLNLIITLPNNEIQYIAGVLPNYHTLVASSYFIRSVTSYRSSNIVRDLIDYNQQHTSKENIVFHNELYSRHFYASYSFYV